MPNPVMTYNHQEEDDFSEVMSPMEGQQLDLMSQMVAEQKRTNELLEALVLSSAPQASKDEAYEIGTRVAAMDDRRTFNRPPRPPVPEWAYELKALLDQVSKKFDMSNAEIAEEMNPTLERKGHPPMAINYINKLRNPDTQMHSFTKGAWQTNVNLERPRVQDIIRIANMLLEE